MTMKFAAKFLNAFGLRKLVWMPQARADDTSDDVKCLAVAMNMTASQNPDDQSVGILSTMYWLGRLDGHNPGLDLEKQLDDAGTLSPTELQTETARCVATLRTRGEMLSRLGQSLQQKPPQP